MSQQNTQLWMGFIEPYMNDFFLATAFIKMGVSPVGIRTAKKLRATSNEKTYGFIQFKTELDALDALQRCNNKTIPNSDPPIKFKLNHIIGPAEFTAYVGDLPSDVDDNKLFKVFADKFPTLRSAKVSYENNHSRGYGFLVFGTEGDYKQCMQTMNGFKINGKPIKVNYSYRETVYSNPEELCDDQFWAEFTSLSDNYYPPVSQDLLQAHSIQIPSFSRLYTRNELNLMDYSVKLDYNMLNSARSAQSHCLWDPLLVSGFCTVAPDHYENVSINSCC